MHNLPQSIIYILSFFAPVFSRPVFLRITLLFKGHLLSKGRRTVCDLLRCLGLENASNFSMYHRVFYGAVWHSLKASKILFTLILLFFPSDEIIIAIDTHVERRKGSKIKNLGIQRDAVNSTKSRKVLIPGLNWLVCTLIVEVPWSKRKWALTFLSILLPPKTLLNSYEGKNRKLPRYKKMTEWTSQVAFLIRRWVGKKQRVTIVADSAFACNTICLACKKNSVGFISRLRNDACLHDFPPQEKQAIGRPRVKGKRLPTPAQIAIDPKIEWKSKTISWYGGKTKEVLMATIDCIWHAGHKNVPARIVIVKPSKNADFQAFFSTDLIHDVEYIMGAYVARWSIEVTFEEARRHLGIETQRQSCEKSILRETPAILASFSMITLIAVKMTRESGEIPIRQASWYKKRKATFSDIYMHIKEAILRQDLNACQVKGRHAVNLFEKLMSLAVAA